MYFHGLLRGHIRPRLRICKTPYGDFCGCRRKTEVILEGVRYLRIEGAFYCGIGCLFLLYGLYRALGKPGMSVVLTVISLGTRVALAYLLSAIPAIGVTGIWCIYACSF